MGVWTPIRLSALKRRCLSLVNCCSDSSKPPVEISAAISVGLSFVFTYSASALRERRKFSGERFRSSKTRTTCLPRYGFVSGEIGAVVLVSPVADVALGRVSEWTTREPSITEKNSVGWSAPSSDIWKSADVRPLIRRPFLSVTIASTCTAAVLTRTVSSCPAGGADGFVTGPC